MFAFQLPLFSQDEVAGTGCLDSENSAGNGCIDKTKTATFDIAQLWGGTGCPCSFDYVERRCPGFSVFDILQKKEYDLQLSNACAQRYNQYRATVVAQGQAAIDRYVLEESRLMTKAGLQKSAKDFIADEGGGGAYDCERGSFVTGRYYEGPCAATCTRTLTWEGKTYIRKRLLSCGINCCVAIQDFCEKGGVLASESPTKYVSRDKIDCLDNPIVGKCSIFEVKSSCVSNCSQNQSKYAPVVIPSDVVTSFSKNLTVNLVNNTQTKILGISFDNLFSGTVSIFDINGRLVHNTTVTKQDETSSLSIDISTFVSGVYAVSFQDTSNNIVTQKITVQRY